METYKEACDRVLLSRAKDSTGSVEIIPEGQFYSLWQDARYRVLLENFNKTVDALQVAHTVSERHYDYSRMQRTLDKLQHFKENVNATEDVIPEVG